MSELVGFTVIAATSVSGDFEGADFNKAVRLDNGMIFTFQEYNYSYSYQPDAAVLARTSSYQGRSLTIYKLVVEDEIYDVTRVR